MALRVVQRATGGVGAAAIKGVLEHPDLDLPLISGKAAPHLR